MPDNTNDSQKICTTLKQNGDQCTKKIECSSGYCDESSHQCQNYPDLKCSDNQHPYGEECEPDDNQNCGSHGNVCDKADFSHAETVSCTNANCVITECNKNYHLDSNNKCIFCESDDLWNEENKTCSKPAPSVKCTDLGSDTNVGDICQFGRYKQYSDTSVQQPIEWIVLDKDEQNGFLLISRYVLDAKKIS